MVSVNVEVALHLHVHVDQRMTRQLLDHMVEKADARRDPVRAGAVEIDRHVDPRLVGVAADGGGAHRRLQ